MMGVEIGGEGFLGQCGRGDYGVGDGKDGRVRGGLGIRR